MAESLDIFVGPNGRRSNRLPFVQSVIPQILPNQAPGWYRMIPSGPCSRQDGLDVSLLLTAAGPRLVGADDDVVKMEHPDCCLNGSGGSGIARLIVGFICANTAGVWMGSGWWLWLS
jgi:hypothetical protein